MAIFEDPYGSAQLAVRFGDNPLWLNMRRGNLEFYNHDTIIHVGYRVNPGPARRWEQTHFKYTN